MEIEYKLTESDILALMRFRLQQSKGRRNPVFVRRFAYLVGFILMSLGGWLLLHNAVLAILFLVFAILSWALYPIYFNRLIQRKVTDIYRDPQYRMKLNFRTLQATDEGLVEISNAGEAKVKWEFIDGIAETTTHAFIAIHKIPTVVVPINKITKGDYKGFMGFCNQQINKGAD